MNRRDLGPGDLAVVTAFQNFLSWGCQPNATFPPASPARPVPPAWWAYVRGFTTWCPPKGEW